MTGAGASGLFFLGRCYLNWSWVVMRNVKIINLNLWSRNCILSFGSFHIHSWDLDTICDHWDHSWERVIVALVGIDSWDLNIANETTMSICECHMLRLIAA
jgi:hypothetical protein